MQIDFRDAAPETIGAVIDHVAARRRRLLRRYPELKGRATWVRRLKRIEELAAIETWLGAWRDRAWRPLT